MPRLTIQQTNFTAGEVSPRLMGRTDVDRYANASQSIVNAYPVIQGGAKRRGGTRFVAAAKTAAVVARLIPFVYSRDAAYMLVFGNLNARVYPAGGGAMLAEIVTPYTEAMLDDIDYAQGENTMFIAHPEVPIQRLKRLTDASWDLRAAPFTTTPFEEQGQALAANLTLSAVTVGVGRTATASAAVFLPSDVGRELVSGVGVATVTAYTDTTHVTVTILTAFAGAALASGDWYFDVSPQAILLPSAKDPVGSTITLTAGLSRAASLTLTAVTGAITINASAAIFSGADTGKTLFADSGIVSLTYVNPTQCTGTTTADFVSLTYAAGGYGITDSAWRATDVGSFVRINGGLVKITTFTSASVVSGTVLEALASVVACPALAWTLETAVWSAANGYPRTLTLHEQRLVAAGSTKFPQTVWGSRTAEYLDFTKGTSDDSSYSFTIASDEVNPISHIASLRDLVVHTYGGEFSMQGGIEKPITPTNVRIRAESAHGSTTVRPVTVGKESLFVQRSGRKVRAMGYRYDVDGYVAGDLTVLADHVTEPGAVIGLAYQQEPDGVVWAWRADGALLSCTLNRDPAVGVVGWAQHFTEGAVECAATIPNGDRDETWLMVRRTVSGVVVRYIEIIDESWEPLLPVAAVPNAYPPFVAPWVYGYTVDCGLAFDNAGGAMTFAVPHLVGKTVDILADGSVMQPQVVPPGGNVTIERTGYRVLVGLHFTSRVKPVTPEVGTGTGTAQGNAMRSSEFSVRLLNTVGGKIIGPSGRSQELVDRRLGESVLDAPPEPFTGIRRIETLGWDRGTSDVEFVQDQPLPMHLLALIRKFTVND